MPGAYTAMIRRDRARRGWSEGYTAWRLGITRTEYRALERGEATVPFELWQRMCETFEWPRAWG
jgi:ribosome-binding protein aMBF1 (putative translation factor)